jgi:rhodanese-related sulfurtransferase
MPQSYAGDILPTAAWEILGREPASALIDVRTPVEWAYVGLPDLSPLGKQVLMLPWQVFPTMAVNERFADQLEQQDLPKDASLVFLCRSGSRSWAAAIAMTQRGFSRGLNVATGFEGDLDARRQRGRVNGWKVDGLPWLQS